MKKLIVAVALLTSGSFAYAAQVNPTSNVLGDTAGTAGTLVLRDSNGVVDAASLIQDASILTAKLANGVITTVKLSESSVTTRKLYLDLISGSAVCVTTAKQLGICTGLTAGTGICGSCL